MSLVLNTFPVRYPPIWLPTTSRLGPKGTRRISFFNNYDRGPEPHGSIDIMGEM